MAGISLTELTGQDIRDRYPQHASVPDHYVGLIDPEGGFVRVEDSVTAAITAAQRLGAHVHDRTTVSGLSECAEGVTVNTTDASFKVRQVILAAGPWMSVMQDTVPLTVFRAPMLWWRARKGHEESLRLENFPAFIRHFDDSETIWGHGATATTPVKLGLSHDKRSRIATHPDQLDRGMSPYRDWSAVVDVIQWAVPALQTEPVEAAPCMITKSPDGQFVIGRVQSQPRVILAGGCSGHGFKHSPAIGELIAQIACDEETFADIDFISAGRFTA
jgi:sarcosine oxidase